MEITNTTIGRMLSKSDFEGTRKVVIRALDEQMKKWNKNERKKLSKGMLKEASVINTTSFSPQMFQIVGDNDELDKIQDILGYAHILLPDFNKIVTDMSMTTTRGAIKVSLRVLSSVRNEIQQLLTDMVHAVLPVYDKAFKNGDLIIANPINPGGFLGLGKVWKKMKSIVGGILDPGPDFGMMP